MKSSVKDKFYSLLKEVIDATPSSKTAVSNALADKAKALIDDAIQRGAKFLAGSGQKTEPASPPPSVLIDINPDVLCRGVRGSLPPCSWLLLIRTSNL